MTEQKKYRPSSGTEATKIFNTLQPTEQRDIYSKRWIRRGDIVPVKRDLLPARFTEINSRRR